MPGAAAAEVIAYYAANPVAVGISAVLQTVSVACLAVFVGFLAPALRVAGAGWVPWAGWLSVVAMVVSSLLAVTLAVVASTAGETAVLTLRQASFYTGGVVTVVALGAFVVGSATVLGRERLLGGGVRGFGLVAGGIALLSVLSLAFYYASIALPIGRVLCMGWTIAAGVAIYRRVRGPRPS